MRLHKTDAGNPWMSDYHIADSQERIESTYTNEMHIQTYKPGKIHSAQGSRDRDLCSHSHKQDYYGFSPAWSKTHYVAQACLKLNTNPPALPSQGLITGMSHHICVLFHMLLFVGEALRV